MAVQTIRLTSLAHGGGCGCKLSPSMLEDILRTMPPAGAYAKLLVGIETGDDAAVWQLNEQQALIATTDFFMPIVDDPHDFGRIAATNALSDVYAMGGVPIMALAIVGMPVGKVAAEIVQDILVGGAAACAAAGIPIAGGHSIDNPEPLYGLVVLGLVRPDRLLRNSGARAGDVLVLTKGIGIGIYSAALKQGALSAELYRVFVDSTVRLNDIGAQMPDVAGVHAMTDVTGFALLGHTLEVCRGSGLGARIRLSDIPILPGAEQLARDGIGTGAAARNWASYGARVRLPDGMPDWQRGLLCDPQTSGGLLIAAAPDAASEVLRLAKLDGLSYACEIGTMVDGELVVTVE